MGISGLFGAYDWDLDTPQGWVAFTVYVDGIKQKNGWDGSRDGSRTSKPASHSEPTRIPASGTIITSRIGRRNLRPFILSRS